MLNSLANSFSALILGTLVIVSPQEEDSDVYICTAQEVTGRFTVTIFMPTRGK